MKVKSAKNSASEKHEPIFHFSPQNTRKSFIKICEDKINCQYLL